MSETGANWKDRLTGDVYSRAELNKAKQDTVVQTLKDLFFNSSGGKISMAESMCQYYEGVCREAKSRDRITLLDPRFKAAASLVWKMLNQIENKGGEFVGWSTEKGFEVVKYDPGKHDLYYPGRDIKEGDRVIVNVPGLAVNGEVVVLPKVAANSLA